MSAGPRTITPELLRGWPLPAPDEHGDKEARGAALVVAGAAEMPGAAILAGTGALRAGAGKLQVATPATAAPLVALALLEAYVLPLPEKSGGEGKQEFTKRVERAAAVLVGPGMRACEELAGSVTDVATHLGSATLVLDAGAMDCLSGRPAWLKARAGQIVLTPHAGEMAHLLGVKKEEVTQDPAGVAERFSREHGVVTVLKGSRTVIATGNGTLYLNEAGNVGLATSGSGDVLSGIISGLAARGASPEQAAVWGVYLHARAGDRLAERLGLVGYLARELAGEVPRLMMELAPQGSRPISLKR